MTCFATFATKWRRPLSLSTLGGALILASLRQGPALAQFWTPHEYFKHHYSIDIPPGFESNGESADGKSATFYALEAEQGFTVWAGEAAGGVEAASVEDAGRLRAQGWVLSEETSTPQWAVLIGQREQRLLVQRLIALCEPTRFAGLRLEFNIPDMVAMAETLAGMTASFKASNC